MSTTSNTGQDLYQHAKRITGQDNLTAADATAYFKYAVDDYSFYAMMSDGVHKFDDITHENSSGNTTYPIATATVSPTNPKIDLDITFLQLDRVTVTVNGVEKPLEAVDRRDHKGTSLTEVYGTSGRPIAYDYDAHGIEMLPNPDASYTATAYYSRAAKYIDCTDNIEEIGIPRIHHYYLILHVAGQLKLRTIDGNRTDVANELEKWEGNTNDGKKGKIGIYWANTDEDRPRRMRVKTHSAFTNNSFSK